MARIVVHLDPDEVNGDVEFYGDIGDTEVVVVRGIEGEVVASYNTPCDCTDQRGWDVFEVDGDDTAGFVQRCDTCAIFDTDEEAAKAASIQTGFAVAWALTQNDQAEGHTIMTHGRPVLVGWYE